jgi:hypothetical protein
MGFSLQIPKNNRSSWVHVTKKLKECDRRSKPADLYAELYDEDEELKKLTESAMDGWPE